MKDKKAKREKRPKSFRVTEKKPHPLWVAFDQYISLFLVPLALFIRAVVSLQQGNPASLEGLIAGIWILFAIIATLATGLFLLLNMYWMRWRLNWWKNILFSIIIFLASTFVFGYIIRAGA